jgi:hypothetical protein
MSHVMHPHIPLSAQVRAHRLIALTALLALMATAAVVLVLALGGGSTADPVAAGGVQPALRVHGGPDESSVAAAVGSRPVAASPGSGPAPATARPDESAIAAAISGR